VDPEWVIRLSIALDNLIFTGCLPSTCSDKAVPKMIWTKHETQMPFVAHPHPVLTLFPLGFGIISKARNFTFLKILNDL
jgi:hypothetical protein